MKAYSIRGLCVALALLVAAGLSAAAVKHSHTENFTTNTYKDALNTTADWDTVSGQLGLAPFLMTAVGSYDTPGNPADVAVAGDLAFVADAGSGLLILDISDPAAPAVVGTYNTPGSAQGIWLHGNLAFVCDDGSGLQIIDISNPAAPSLVGSYNTSGRTFDVEVAGDHAFVADFGPGLAVIDVSNPAAPSLVGSYDTPGSARSIDVEGNYAYIADRSTGGFQVVDITDPTTPVSAGSYATGNDTWGVTVSGNVAYLGVAGGGLMTVDISDPTTPGLLGSVLAGSARRLDVEGDFAYVAGFSAVYVIDVSDPSAPTVVDFYDTPGIASGVSIAGEHAYVADGTAGGMQVLRCARPAGPVRVGWYSPPATYHGIHVSGDYAFAASDVNGLRVLDISDPGSPTLAGSYNTPGNARAVDVSGDFAYVADYNAGFRVIDISDPALPSEVGWFDTTAFAYDVDVTGDLAYVACDAIGLLVFDVSDPSTPTVTGGYNGSGQAYGVHVAGDHAYIAANGYGLEIIDISNPSSPVSVGAYVTFADNQKVFVSGNIAYWASFAQGLLLIDVSDPTTPALLGGINPPGEADDVYVAGNYAYLASGFSGLDVIDVTDPTAPTLVDSEPLPGAAVGVYASGDHVFVASGTGYVDVVQVLQREFDPVGDEGYSLPVNEIHSGIARVRLTTTQADGVTWWVGKVAANVSIEPDGTWLDLTGFPGADVYWRSEHDWKQPGVNPSVSELTLDWLYFNAVIDSIVDIGNDQGRQVSIHWTRSGMDFVGSIEPITEYAIYRRIDPLPSPPLEDRAKGEPPLQMAWPPGSWHYISTVPAHAEDVYATVVPTLADSTIDEGMHHSVFFVRAMTATIGIHHDSEPDSGYSVDNLAPMVPQGFAVAYNSGGGTDLQWEECPDVDFQYFAVYRGTSDDFTPDPGNRVHMTTGTNWRDDVAGGYGYYYKVTAVDFSGNESPPALAGSVTGVENTATPKRVTLGQNAPNPFNPSTTITIGLPAASPVRLSIFDVNGRLVRTLADATVPAGFRSFVWHGRDDKGNRVGSGVYFYRLEAAGETITRKMVLLK
jgi:hypothetical protein